MTKYPPHLIYRTIISAPLAVIVLLLAGCAGGRGPEAAGEDAGLVVVDPFGLALPYSRVTATSQGNAVAVLSTDADGRAEISSLESTGADALSVWSPGFTRVDVPLSDVPSRIVLDPIGYSPATSVGPFLGWRDAVLLDCPTGIVQDIKDVVYFNDKACGGMEPVMGVQGDGTLWVSTTLQILVPTPIWVSRDGGQSFDLKEGEGTGMARDIVGIEGDFGFDAAGNVYFFDILGENGWFTSWTPDGTHRWTVPGPVEPPFVDRPWVRGGEADEVFIQFNDLGLVGTTTFMRSIDGGLTFDRASIRNFPCTGMFGQGPTRNDLVIVGIQRCSDHTDSAHPLVRVWSSHDGGDTWSDADEAPLPVGDYANRGMYPVVSPVVDDAGNLYIVYTHTVGVDADEVGLMLVRRDANGTWAGPFDLGVGGTNLLPWVAAGREGRIGVAWMHTDETASRQDQQDAVWRLMVAASIDADTATPHFQVTLPDVEPVLYGPGMYLPPEGQTDPLGLAGRDDFVLGDFYAAEITPDGDLVVSYAHRAPQDRYATSSFLRSDGGLDFTPRTYLAGPQESG